MLVYVDDIIVTSDHPSHLSTFITKLSFEFAIKDLGPLNYFLGVQVSHFGGSLFLSQHKYAKEILAKASMTDCEPIGTPLAQKHHLQLKGGPLVDATNYRSIVGALQYLTLTRPDLTHAVNLVCQFMHQPGTTHFQAVKRILRYLQGTLDYGIRLLSHSSLTLYSFSDADWVGALTLAAPLQAIVFIWVLIVFLGPQRNKLRSPNLAPKLNIAPWPLLLLNSPGSLIFCVTLVSPHAPHQFSSVITLVHFI